MPKSTSNSKLPPLKLPPAPMSDARAASLAKMETRHPLVAARFLETHGLVLSRQVMLLAAFWDSLSPSEREALSGLSGLGFSPFGIGQWYFDGALERPLKPGLDARLDARYRRTPPEFVTVMGGHSDGLHFGFVHDEPAAAPWLLASIYARDSAELVSANGCGYTILDFFYFAARRAIREGSASVDVSILFPAIAEFLETGAEIIRAEHPKRSKKPFHRLTTLCGIGPILPSRFTPDPTWPSIDARRAAYRGNSPEVDAWIARAEAELAQGHPGLALMMGHDLYFLDDPARTASAVALLDAGYRAIGRDALAEILQVHAKHRDLRSVSVFEARGA